MCQELAEEFYFYFGGDVDLCERAVEQLKDRGKDFNPLQTLKWLGFSSCVSNNTARSHLQKMFEKGWSPVYDLKHDAGAELIARENVGGVIPCEATIFNAPKDMLKGRHEHVLIPSGRLMRWKIAEELELPLDMRNSF